MTRYLAALLAGALSLSLQAHAAVTQLDVDGSRKDYKTEADNELKDFKTVSLCKKDDAFDFFLGPVLADDVNKERYLKGTRLKPHSQNYTYLIGLSPTVKKYRITEEKRASRFEDDIKTLYSLIPKLKGSDMKLLQDGAGDEIPCIRYVQAYKRSTIKIELAYAPIENPEKSKPENANGFTVDFFRHKPDDTLESQLRSPAIASRQSDHGQTLRNLNVESRTKTEAEDESLETRTTDLIAGPREMLYLSADLPVTKVKELQYDKASNQVTEKDAPENFYLGLNINPFYDVYTQHRSEVFYRNFSLKLLVKASSRPRESMGVGLGYRFGMMDVFVAHMRTQDDPDISSGGGTSSTAAGVSFNISKAVDWLSGD